MFLRAHTHLSGRWHKEKMLDTLCILVWMVVAHIFKGLSLRFVYLKAFPKELLNEQRIHPLF